MTVIKRKKDCLEDNGDKQPCFESLHTIIDINKKIIVEGGKSLI